MKNTKIKFAIIGFLVCLLYYSCGTPDDEQNQETPYYKFQQIDQQFLLNNYNSPSKRLVFENQHNDEFSFILKKFEDEKRDYSNGSGGFGPVIVNSGPAFYYDTRKIEFEFEQYQEPIARLGFTFNRFSDTLRAGIRFPLWNIDRYYISSNGINFDQYTFEMIIDNITYSNVIKLNSDITTVEFTIGTYSRNVNIIYYDLFLGLVGFDDLEGGEWRLQQ